MLSTGTNSNLMDTIKSMEHENPRHSDFVTVNWCITTRCNFRCPYCSKDLNGGQFPGLGIEQCRQFVNRVIDHYGNKLNKKVYFELTGGEATLYPHLLDLLQHIKNKGGYTGLMSNGSLAIQKWDAIIPVLDHLCLSFHPRQSRPAQFLQLVEKVYQATSAHFNVMMYPPLFEQSLEMGRSLRSILSNASFNLLPLLEALLPGMPIMQYTPAQQKEMEDFDCSVPWNKEKFSTRGRMKLTDLNDNQSVMEPSLLGLKGLNRWKGWKCWTGVESLVVQPDGKVLRAWCQQDALGYLQAFDWTFPVSPTICRLDSCHASCDMMTRKTSPRNTTYAE